MTTVTRNPWFRAGDANAFFALMFDNVANLVILVAILVGAFSPSGIAVTSERPVRRASRRAIPA